MTVLTRIFLEAERRYSHESGVTLRMNENLKLDYEQETKRPFTDNLTGLFNHGFLQMFLDHVVKRARRYAIPFTLGLVDIDSFSLYNHQHTALQGDCMLQNIADIIRTNVRQADLIARYALSIRNDNPIYQSQGSESRESREIEVIPTMVFKFAPLRRSDIAENNGFVALEMATMNPRQTARASSRY